ncbi:type II toxin-antitoxin system RelE/ParE family toxin [Candidatus Falkowbacteria bacterium]|jgi:toxin HigB-1|nr:type II toxin-antitoxin system RelE/ParE family toxin [Candidatus Falkowbacteria bacterium]MBT4433377.1 type II toxin-antitoxin system RelE/ParE family toxin [Candidatus Falkowbacteria bacterium]
MIKSFSCKETKKIFNCEFSKKIPHSIQRVAMRKLLMIDASTQIQDLRIPPSNNLKILHGAGKKYSVRINKQWRVCFDWKNNDAYNIEIIDYH